MLAHSCSMWRRCSAYSALLYVDRARGTPILVRHALPTRLSIEALRAVRGPDFGSGWELDAVRNTDRLSYLGEIA